MNEPRRGFPDAEFEARTEAAQRLMAEQGLNGLLLTTEPEVRYFSGFHTAFWQSPTRPWFLFVPARGKPVAVIPEIGAELMARGWLDDIRTWPAPRPDDDGISELAALLAGLGRVGMPMGPETHLRMPLADFERLRSRLPGVEFVDCTDIIRALRMVKSPAEQEKIARACAIVCDTFDALAGFAGPGVPLEKVFREFRRTALELGADEVPYLVGGAAPGGYDDIISPPGARPLATGDILMLDTGTVFDGYFADFDRNFAIGRADSESRRAHETLWQATEAGLAAARPGATCRELFRAMARVIEANGYGGGSVGRFGHGLGMQLTEWPSIADFDETEIRPGMVLTLEPSLGHGDGRVMVHEENIVVEDGPPRLLTRRTPRELPVIGGDR